MWFARGRNCKTNQPLELWVQVVCPIRNAEVEGVLIINQQRCSDEHRQLSSLFDPQ
jgi:hypothetical protein